MAQCLGALDALAVDLGSVFNTPACYLTTLTPVPGTLHPLVTSRDTHKHIVPIYQCRQNILAHKINMSKIAKIKLSYIKLK